MAQVDMEKGDTALRSALARGETVNDAARVSGVSVRTVYRRLNDPAFKAELDRVKRNILDRTTAQLSEAGLSAIATLRKLLKSGKEPIRLSAARCILEMGDRYRTALDVDDRLSVLESRLENEGGRRR